MSKVLARPLALSGLDKGLAAFEESEIPAEPIAVLRLEPEELADRLDLPFAETFDKLDIVRVCVLELPSNARVALLRHQGAPEPGTEVAVATNVNAGAVLEELLYRLISVRRN